MIILLRQEIKLLPEKILVVESSGNRQSYFDRQRLTLVHEAWTVKYF